MRLEEAKKRGECVIDELSHLIEKGEIAGSIRRKKSNVGDIDLVIQPKNEFMVLDKIKSILKKYGEITNGGTKVIRVKSEDDVKIDCYLANEENYEVILLIRTGSKEHNRKLAIEALKQGKKLNFARGLIDIKTNSLISNTEKGIFEALKLKYLEPEERV
jgi:DNA polymerase/3'-5' exonuclease PolX